MKSNLEKDLEEKIETADDLLYKRESTEALKILLSVSDKVMQSVPQLQYRYLEVLGEAYSENNREEEAIECFDRALHMTNVEIDEPFLYYHLGSSYAELGDDKKGIFYLQEALSSEKERPYLLNILTQLTTCYQNLNQYEEAIKTSQRLIQEFYPSADEMESERVQMAYLGLVANYWKIGNEEYANLFYDKLVMDSKTKSWILAKAYGIRGHRYFEQNDFAKAIKCYSKAIELASQSSKLEDLDAINIWREWLEKAKSRL